MKAKGSFVGALVLLVMAICWGSTFFSTKSVLNRLPVTDYLTIRFDLAALVLIAIAPKSLRMPRKVAIRAVIIGLVFAVAQMAQMFGLPLVSASVSGFITGLYVVVTPLLGAIMFKTRPKPVVWVAVFMATIGLGVLSIQWHGGLRLGLGEWLTLISAVLWGVQITLIGHWVRPENVMSLTLVQTIVAAVIFSAAGFRDGLTLPSTPSDWAWMLYFAIIVGAVTEVAQFWAQVRVQAALAAVLMCTEPLWATVFAVLFGGESLTPRLLVGGGTMMVAMVVSIWASGPSGDLPADQSVATMTGVLPAANVVPEGTSAETSASPMGPNS